MFIITAVFIEELVSVILRRLAPEKYHQGQFALDIFRQDTSNPKEEFRKMRAKVDRTTTYAGQWLPKDYLSKSIGTFGKSVFQSIIMSTVEHRREEIIQMINKFDDEV